MMDIKHLANNLKVELKAAVLNFSALRALNCEMNAAAAAPQLAKSCWPGGRLLNEIN
jgi:hypothetical protein